MDFFHRLDQGRYAMFIMSMLNGWAMKAFDPPETTSDIYRITGAWVKPTAKIERGTAATFMTIEEEARINKKHSEKKKGIRRKQRQQQWQHIQWEVQ